MNILFYDIHLINLKNYVGDLICLLSEKHTITLLYDEYSDVGFEYFEDVNCRLIKCNRISYVKINDLLTQVQPDLVIVNAQRISDSSLISIAKKRQITTLMIQHGMYIPFMKREKFFFLQKFVKTFKYFLHSQVVAKAIQENRMNVFFSFFRVFVKGDVYKSQIYFKDKINADFVFVYGDYWKKYHADNFGYSPAQQYTIGYHELCKANIIKETAIEPNTICYIAQTLVEDGRLDRERMVSFLDSLTMLEVDKIYVKLHPRSDLTLYQSDRFVLLADHVPHAEKFVGHYSSLLALVANLDSKLYLFEFESHPIPDYFKAVSEVSDDMTFFFDLINNNSNRHIKSDFSYFFSPEYSTARTFNIIEELPVLVKI